MKVFIEEYGRFMVAFVLGIALLAILFATTILNGRLMDRLIPDERNMSLRFLSNVDVMKSDFIPEMDIVDSVVLLINPNNNIPIDFMDPSIVHKVTDGQEKTITKGDTWFVPMEYARDASKLKPDKLNIIGTNAVNSQVKGDYKVTYYYENSETGYKNVHDLVVCVRRPYITHEYIQATGNQYIDTGILAISNSTALTIEYQPVATNRRQDIISIQGMGSQERLRFGIFITANGTWGYSYGERDIDTGIAATTAKTEVTLDSVNHQFIVGNRTVAFPADLASYDGTSYGWIHIFKEGQSFGKLYSCQIFQNGTPERNMFPVYAKAENTFGLWDSIDWVALPNKGAQYPPFTIGKEIDE